MPAGLNGIFGRMVVVAVILGDTLVASAQYGGGTGTAADPYLIYTPGQMNAIGVNPVDWDSHFKLMADLDLSEYTGTEFNIIGASYYQRFTGVFDGNGHTISNFTYVAPGGDCVGLFGSIYDEGAKIKNLGLIDPHVAAGNGSQVGCLAGYFRGKIANCYVRGGRVSGVSRVGGLVGRNGEYFGLEEDVLDLPDTITNCYSSGPVSGSAGVGGLVGLQGWGSATASFWDTQTSGRTVSDGGVGKTTAQMQAADTYRAAGWDFLRETENGTEGIWWILEGRDYPRLWWEMIDDSAKAPLSQ